MAVPCQDSKWPCASGRSFQTLRGKGSSSRLTWVCSYIIIESSFPVLEGKVLLREIWKVNVKPPGKISGTLKIEEEAWSSAQQSPRNHVLFPPLRPTHHRTRAQSSDQGLHLSHLFFFLFLFQIVILSFYRDFKVLILKVALQNSPCLIGL